MAGRFDEALALQRALVLRRTGRRGRGMADALRLLRWELGAGAWPEALKLADAIGLRLVRRGAGRSVIAGWIALAGAVAVFEVGVSGGFRQGLARALRVARRRRSRSLLAACMRIGAFWESQASVSGEGRGYLCRRWSARGLEEGGGERRDLERRYQPSPRESIPCALPRREAHVLMQWRHLASLIAGPESGATSPGGATSPDGATSPEGGTSPRPMQQAPETGENAGSQPATSVELARAALRGLCEPVAGEGGLVPEWLVPAWLVPALAGAAEAIVPDVGAPARKQIHRGLCRLTAALPEPWARARALEAAAEVALWLAGEPKEGTPADRADILVGARADLGLAAGLLRRLGWLERADRCEQRWSRLSVPALQARVAEGTGAARPRVGLDRIGHGLREAGFITGDDRVLQELAPAVLLAASPLPVLILGESGTGKEVLARAIHRWSQCRGEFVPIHCGAIPKDLLESELFGHARGAFTGAAAEKPGLIEAADGGTLFLDEIGEMGPEAQMKILRVLESGEVRRLGELRSRRAAIRLVAATHRHLEAAVEAGTFRLDLFHRIRGITVRLRPLRERRGDIALLAARYVEEASRAGSPLGLPESSLACLLGQAWPGNVRELRSVMARGSYLARALGVSLLTPEILGVSGPSVAGQTPLLPLPSQGPPSWGARVPSREEVAELGLEQVLDDIERRLIVTALEDAGWNRTQAARRLGGISRTTLISKIKRLGIVGGADPEAGPGASAVEDPNTDGRLPASGRGDGCLAAERPAH